MKPIEVLHSFIFKEAFEYLSKLTISQKPLWGNMDAQQMVEHLALAVKVSNGKLQPPLLSDPAKVDKIKQISLLSARPLPKGFQNEALPSTPLPYQSSDLAEAIQILKNELIAFEALYQQNPDIGFQHNLFGRLNFTEWLYFHYKHFHHHFAQFNLIPYVERFED